MTLYGCKCVAKPVTYSCCEGHYVIRATIQDLAGYLDVSPRTAARVVKNLRDAGQIHRVGSNKTGSWECGG